MAGLFELSAWLTEAGCTQVAIEATGVYWKDASHNTTSPSVTASSYHRPVFAPCCRHCRVSVKDSDGVLAVVPGERDELVQDPPPSRPACSAHTARPPPSPTLAALAD